MIKEIRALKKNDGEIDCEISITEVVVPQGSPRAFTAIMRDITARKLDEEKLKKTLLNLERSNAELVQFAYIASHDLQEPLRMVSSFVQLLARRYAGKFDADADEFIRNAVDGTTRMQEMINALLEFSRVGSNVKPFVSVDYSVVFDQTVNNMKVAIEESGALITHDKLPTVIADELQMVQLLQNLIGNSIKFTNNGPPRIHVSAAKQDSEWVFSVHDNGIGIEPEYFERIFTIFQRLHSKAEYSGSGIGLSICKKIIERHGGRIWIESQTGKGSTFYFSLPDMET